MVMQMATTNDREFPALLTTQDTRTSRASSSPEGGGAHCAAPFGGFNPAVPFAARTPPSWRSRGLHLSARAEQSPRLGSTKRLGVCPHDRRRIVRLTEAGVAGLEPATNGFRRPPLYPLSYTPIYGRSLLAGPAAAGSRLLVVRAGRTDRRSSLALAGWCRCGNGRSVGCAGRARSARQRGARDIRPGQAAACPGRSWTGLRPRGRAAGHRPRSRAAGRRRRPDGVRLGHVVGGEELERGGRDRRLRQRAAAPRLERREGERRVQLAHALLAERLADDVEELVVGEAVGAAQRVVAPSTRRRRPAGRAGQHTSSTQTGCRSSLPSPGTGTTGARRTRSAIALTKAESSPPNMMPGRATTHGTPLARNASSPRAPAAQVGAGSPREVSIPPAARSGSRRRPPAARARLASAVGVDAS